MRIPLRGEASGWVSDGAGDLADGVAAAVMDGGACSTPPTCRGGCASAGMPRRIRPPIPNLEKQALKNQAEALQSELDFIKKRLSEFETGTAAE